VSNLTRITNSLYARRRRLVTALAKLERKADAYRASIADIEAELGTLVLFVPPLDTRRKPISITRDVLTYMREASSVLTTRDIARWFIAKQAIPSDPKLRGSVQQSVGACLRRLQKQGVLTSGEGRGASVLWCLAYR